MGDIRWFAVGLCCGVAAAGQGLAPALTVEQIAANMASANAHRDATLHGYESRRVMRVTYQSSLGNGEATETVDMTFTAPGPKRFSIVSADGPQLIRDAVFQRAIDSEAAAAAPEAKRAAALTLQNYDMRLLRQEERSAGNCYVLDVVPKTASPYAFVGRVWVQTTDFAVVRVEGKPAQDVSLWAIAGEFTTTYAKVGAFYFPSRTTSASQLRLGGTASLTIQYGPYRLLD